MAIILVLRQNSSNTLNTGVSLKCEISIEGRVRQHWGFTQLPLQGLKGSLTLFVPDELCFLLGQLVKWSCDLRK
jgi:hypothetical protein